MKVTICQLNATTAHQLESGWQGLVAHCQSNQSELLLLPEMPFYRWLAAEKSVDVSQWDAAVTAHEQWQARFVESKAAIVAGTQPVHHKGERLNAAFIWTAETGLQIVHHKYYLPDEPGFWEATWYQRGSKAFKAVTVQGCTFGFAICTEMWFMEHARDYAEQGVHFLLCPRSTPFETTDKWLAGGQAAAVISGAFCLSSNHSGQVAKTTLGGVGWLSSPEGELLARSSKAEPYLTVDVDVSDAEKAKTSYPRYVQR